MSQLGRIGGQVLTDNLLRAGVDLAFETNLLYFDVTNKRIGIRNASPIYDLDVTSHTRTTDLTVDTQIAVGNIRINSPNTFTTSVGGIDVYINGGGQIFHDRLTTSSLILNDNLISSISNSNIVLDPNGSGTVELMSDTNITGNLGVTGNISMSGNLTGLGTLTLGDQTIDTVTVNTDFTQSIIPGEDLIYALGADASDSSPRRWAELHSPEWRYITDGAWDGSGLRPQSMTVSGQMTLNGAINKLSAIQSNEDFLLSPDTGITYIERTKWQDSDITNLNNTPLTIASTGNGYYVLAGTNAFVMPAGDESQRRVSPEVGETRWNTDQGYIECYDGSIWIVSIGPGDVVQQSDMEFLGEVYTLILG